MRPALLPSACLLLGLALTRRAPAADAPLPVLRSAAEVRGLTVAEARRGYPVHLQATVLLNDHVAAGDALNVIFVHDGQTSVFAGVHGPAPDLRPGDVVTLAGRTDAGGYAPYVTDPRFGRLGAGPLPAPHPISISEALSGHEDSQWAELAGVVRSVAVKEDRLHLQLAAGRERLEVEFAGPGRAASASLPLVDASVRVRGIVCPVFNRRRQLLGASLYSPDPADVQVVTPPPADPFAGPALSYDALLQYSPGRTNEHRAKVRGEVSFCLPGKALFLADGGQGLLVQTSQGGPAQVGDEVEAVGFPAAGVYKATLEDGCFRRLGPGRAPLAVHAIDAAAALSGEYDATLVRMSGRLVRQFQTGTETVLVLEDGGAHLFSAHLPPRGGSGAPLAEDSVVSVTGLCVAAGTLHTENNAWRPEAFQLLVSSPDSVAVVSTPPRWTRRLLAAMGAVSLVLALSLLWVRALRRRVASQTHVIQEQSRREATLEERNRIARELHDTLAQSFAGSAFALEGVASRLRQESHATYPQVDMALQTVRNGLTEARRSLLNLRAAPLESRDLADAIRAAAQGLVQGTDIALRLRLAPLPVPLSTEVENDLYRIAVEAVTNAVRHGSPRRLTVELSGTAHAATLRVTDDGTGFDPASVPLDHHYGLLGMRERTGQIHGSLQITSAPGQGVDVRLTLPLPAARRRSKNARVSPEDSAA